MYNTNFVLGKVNSSLYEYYLVGVLVSIFVNLGHVIDHNYLLYVHNIMMYVISMTVSQGRLAFTYGKLVFVHQQMSGMIFICSWYNSNAMINNAVVITLYGALIVSLLSRIDYISKCNI